MSNELAWCLGDTFAGETRLGEAKSAGAAQFTMGHAATSGEAPPQRNRDLSLRRPDRPAEHGRRTHPRKVVTADAVLRAFNTWAFKREQPSDPQLLALTVAAGARAGGAPS